MDFEAERLIWRKYLATETLLIISQMQLSNKLKFTKANLDKNSETFVMHMIALEAAIPIHFTQIAQIATL